MTSAEFAAAATALPLTSIFPIDTSISSRGRLALGGCDTLALVERFGSPLYVFDETTLRSQARAFVRAFGERYPDAIVRYAAKAHLTIAFAHLFADEGLSLDVVSGGELAVALAGGFPAERIEFHGNNKTPQELDEALRAGVGRVAVDNLDEVRLLASIAERLGVRQAAILRVGPNVDPHTHGHTTTGLLDSKFGLPISTGQAEEAVRQMMASPHIELRGIHAHLGSPIFETEPYRQAIDVMAAFAADMRYRYDFECLEFSPGGGFAVQYVRETPAPEPDVYAEAIVAALRGAFEARDLPLPRLSIEPGRALVARAGVALYTVGARKEIPGVRTYVSVDGGMADNIRPAIYGSRYEALVANRPLAAPEERVTIAGKYCESGDVLIRDIELPRLVMGDVLAVPAAGAYCLAMSSNYNLALRPAVVLVREGRARLVQRRETYADLMSRDVMGAEEPLE
ncbi:MAG TPA: diaminopimelate decarboxylase [Dehalococcoidia bacterium]|nr:diaminopimelate decarboxylase [Dehalococcoidia bacterium]